MTRRGFLALCGTAALAPLFWGATGLFGPSTPVLYGDGRHDDTAAMQAWGAGRPVVTPDGREVGDVIDGLTICLTGGFVIARPNWTISHCNILGEKLKRGEALITVGNGSSELTLSNYLALGAA